MNAKTKYDVENRISNVMDNKETIVRYFSSSYFLYKHTIKYELAVGLTHVYPHKRTFLTRVKMLPVKRPERIVLLDLTCCCGFIGLNS